MKRMFLGVTLLVMLLALPAMAVAESVSDPVLQCHPGDHQDGCPPVPGDPSKGGIIPVVYPDNPRCDDVGDCGNSLKIKCDPVWNWCGFYCDCYVKSGTYTSADGEFTVNIQVTSDGKYFKWQSNIPVCSVIVKGGNQGANVYFYEGATSDGDLHAPPNIHSKFWNPCFVGGIPEISYIIFCYEEPVPPVPGFPTVTLIGAGLVGLGGFAWFRLRRPKHTGENTDL